ncbi:MAG: DUF4956 domain-containing protein [Phycisphaerales bacterium]
MPEWLNGAFVADQDLSPRVLALRLAAALVAGVVVAGIYRITHGKGDAQSRSLMATVVLLSVLIAMTTLVIGNSVARAFSLVGALAIVRFRTVVEDTRDTAFVIFAVSVGMAIGAGFLLVPVIGVPVAALAAWLFRPAAFGDGGGSRAGDGAAWRLTVRTGLAAPEPGAPQSASWRRVLEGRTRSAALLSASTTRQGSALETVMRVHLSPGTEPEAVVAELNRVPGVHGAELARE